MIAHRGAVLVHAGREQPAEIHLLVNAINAALGAFGATIGLIEPVAVTPPSPQSLDELIADINAGAVDTLLMLDTNPVYSAPADLDFAGALVRVPFSASLTLYPDETAQASGWTVPKLHEYETWSDARAFNGVATIQQPQVLPLYGGHSAHEVLGVLQGNTAPNPSALVRETWEQWAEKEGAQKAGAATSPRSGTKRCAPASSRTAQRRHCRFRASTKYPPPSANRRSRPRSASGCCSGPTRRSGTDVLPTMPGCWSCRARLPA